MFENLVIQSGSWLQWGALIGASLVAAAIDLKHGRIPNWLTLPLWLLGLAQAASAGGAGGLIAALEVGALLGLPYVVLFFLGKGGAGDAKLMAGIGTWLSLDEGLVVLCCVATTGMVMALLRMATRHAWRNPFARISASLYLFAAAWCSGARGRGLFAHNDEGRVQEPTGPLALPYGMAIFIGVCLGAVGVKLWIGQVG